MFDNGKNKGLKIQVLDRLKNGERKLLHLGQKIAKGNHGKELQAKMHRLKKKLDRTNQNFDGYVKELNNYIEKNPKKSVAIAAAAGILAGALWNSFRNRK